jgi:pilus assembly protein CpaE
MSPPELLILEIGNNMKEEIRALYSIRKASPGMEIFLISSNSDPRALIELRRAGAKKIFIPPVKNEEVRAALVNSKNEKNAAPSAQRGRKSGEIIYAIGSKGGVGTTTIALNLASSLAALDKFRSVILTDITLPFGDIPTLLNIRPSPDWAQISKNLTRIDSTSLKNILFEHPDGFYVLPSPGGVKEGQRINPERFEKLLSVLKETYDFIVLDGGKSFIDDSIGILRLAETVLLITSLSNPCIVNAKRLFSIIQRIAPPLEEKIKIVVNRYQKNSSALLGQLEEDLNKEIFCKIPNDYQTTMAAIKRGQTITQVGKGKEINDAFVKLAASILDGDKKGREEKESWEKVGEKGKLPQVALSTNWNL